MRQLLAIFFASFFMKAGAQPIHTVNKNVPVKPEDSVSVRISNLSGNLYFLDCINGFGGGNVAASIGDDGILLVDDMFAAMGTKLQDALKTLSAKPIRMILNTHFHGDHIQGNRVFKNSAVIIAQENVSKRLVLNNKPANPTDGIMPAVTFADSLTVHFNGEDIKLIHPQNCHTDADAVIWFTKSKVVHFGDMVFFDMFPAVYTEGGGDIRKLVSALEKIAAWLPADAKVIPGHGHAGNMDDLRAYIAMLKKTISIIEKCIHDGKTVAEMQQQKVLAEYDELGAGGAQTTDQFTAMLYKLLQPVARTN